MVQQNLKTFLLVSVLFVTFAYGDQQCPTALTSNPDPQPSSSTDLFSSKPQVDSFFPLTPVRIGQIVLILFITGLANAGGIGGGPLLSPIFIVVLGYAESDAIEMVYALVFGGSLGNFINVSRRRDPKTMNPLINYDLNLLCMPPMLLGVILGVTLNRIIAPVCIIIGLVGVAAYSLPKMYKKAQKEFIKETSDIKVSKEARVSLITESVLGINTDKESFVEDSLNDTEIDVQEDKDQQARQKLPALFPKAKVGVILVLIVIILTLAVFRGTQRFASVVKIPYCGIGYWLIYGLCIIICSIATFLVLRPQRKAIVPTESFYNAIDGQNSTLEAAGQSKMKLALISFITGVLASTLGVGGGMIMSPTLLTLGMSAQTVAATSGFFVVQTTFVSLFQSCLYGDIPLQDRGLMLITAVIGSYCISFCLSWLVKKYERPSILLYILVALLVLCLIATPVCVIWRNFDNINRILTFQSVC